MANVRVSGKITEAIKDKCNQMKNTALSTLPSSSVSRNIRHNDPLWVKAVEFIHYRYWGDRLHWRTELPSGWIKTPARVDIHYQGVVLFVENDQGLTIKLPPPVVSSMPDLYIRDVDPDADKLFASLLADNAAMKEIVAKYEALSEQLTRFVQGFSSVNAALKAMPELELYLSADIMRKVNEVVVRNTRAVMETPAVDVESVVALAVAHQIQSANR